MIATKKRSYKENKRAKQMREQHQAEIILELGPAAFDLLSPKETAHLLGIPTPGLINLIRNSWIVPAPAHFDIGHAHRYFRWDVELARRYRRQYIRKPEDQERPNL